MSEDSRRGDRRSETARRHDDSEIIDKAEAQDVEAAEQQGREGGNLQRDIATQAELGRASDPDSTESVKKGDHMAHGQFSNEPHPARHVVTERD